MIRNENSLYKNENDIDIKCIFKFLIPLIIINVETMVNWFYFQSNV